MILGSRLLRILVLASIAAFLICPVVLALLLSLAPPDQTGLTRVVPHPVSMSNFRYAVDRGNALQCILNSLWLGIVSAGAGVLLGFPVAYLLARYDFPFKIPALSMLLLLRLLPKMPAIAAYYHFVSRLGLLDRLVSIALVRGGGIILAVWLMKASIERVPVNLERAALLDGLSHWYVLFRITGRLALPGVAAAFLLEFASAWNSFLLPLLFIESPGHATVALGIDRFLSGNALETGAVTAFALLVSAPLLLLIPGMLSRTLSPYRHRLSRGVF